MIPLLPRLALLLVLSPASVFGAIEPAAPQSADYPSRPVSFIVPFAPGGVTSLFARVLGAKLEQRLGKPFVVENRPGGGGVTAAAAVPHAAPGGHPILVARSPARPIHLTMRNGLPDRPPQDPPPLGEVGVPGFDTASWHTVTTTGGVPKPIVDMLAGHIREIMSDAAVTEALVKDGALPQVSPSPDEMRLFVEREIMRWGKVV